MDYVNIAGNIDGNTALEETYTVPTGQTLVITNARCDLIAGGKVEVFNGDNKVWQIPTSQSPHDTMVGLVFAADSVIYLTNIWEDTAYYSLSGSLTAV